MNPTVLILGAHGRFGAAAAQAFADAGWNVVAQVRRDPGTFSQPRIRTAAVALDDTDGLVAAAAGARAVVHAINPVYTRWADEVLPLGRQGMDVAQRLGALFMLPGNVYGYGAGMPERLTPQTPERPTTAKGHLRVALEADMRDRAAQGLDSVVIRAGDFYGGGTGSWFDQAIVKSLAAGKLVYPGPLDRAHAWAYLPDLARAFVSVAQASRPRGFTNLTFAGHTLTGAQLLDAIEAAARDAGVVPRGGVFRRRSLPWPLIRAGGLFVPMWRELAAMSYLWTRPHGLDGSALERLAGPQATTPPAQAIAAALRPFIAAARTEPATVTQPSA